MNFKQQTKTAVQLFGAIENHEKIINAQYDRALKQIIGNCKFNTY